MKTFSLLLALLITITASAQTNHVGSINAAGSITAAGAVTSPTINVSGTMSANATVATNSVTTPLVQTVKVAPQDASGSNIPGTNAVVAGGVSTGTGRAGSLILQTGLTGTTGSATNALTARWIASPKPVTMTSSGTATTIMNIPIATGKFVAVRVFLSGFASDGTEFLADVRTWNIVAVNKAGTVTTSQATVVGNATAASSGTISTAVTSIVNGTSIDIKAAVTIGTVVPTTLNVTWQAEINSNDAITVTPQ